MDETTRPLSTCGASVEAPERDTYGSSVTVQQNLIPRHYLLDLPQTSPAPSMEVQVKDRDGNLYRGVLFLVVDEEVEHGRQL